METSVSLEERYARACSARSTWFVRAGNAPRALSLLGLADGARLVVCANDFATAFSNGFAGSSVRFIDAPVVDEFVRAGRQGDGRGGSLVWFANAIGCKGLRVANVRELAAAARAEGALLVIDNTVPSYFGCDPLSLGAHVSLEALDRVAEGRLRCKCVAVSVARDKVKQGRRLVDDPIATEAYRKLRALCASNGADSGFGCDPADARAISVGLDTLSARMQLHMDSARAIAEYLLAHPAVDEVHYPGLSGHRDRAVAANVLMHGCGPAVDFKVGGGASAGDLFRKLDDGYRSSPAGGSHTRLSARDGEGEGFLRLFAGTDDPMRVVDDLDKAIRSLAHSAS